METDLKGRVGIVTGASRGIGRAIALQLSGEGMRIVLAARSEDQLAEVAKTCPAESYVFSADLRLEESSKKLIDFAVEKFGRIDLLVNNAGATKRGDFLLLSEDDWQDGFALKFFSTVRCSRAAWPFLMKTKGSIVNIVGIGGRTGNAEFAIGGAANAAILNLTKVLADRGLNDGVRVNAINPSTIKTERLQIRIDKIAADRNISVEQAASEMAKKLGVARFGDPSEIATAVVFLASSMSSYCQGTILDVDGGQTRTL
jgi:NAD(P)-dependent dehydrogenase (short-subunit alcohol dehydrogenase family)